MVSSKILRAFADDAFDACKDAPRGLREQFRLFETEARKALAGGSIVSTSANGRHVAMASAAAGQITQVQIVEAWRRLIDSFDATASNLGLSTDGTDRNVDAQIKADMFSNDLLEVTGWVDNFMYLSK